MSNIAILNCLSMAIKSKEIESKEFMSLITHSKPKNCEIKNKYGETIVSGEQKSWQSILNSIWKHTSVPNFHNYTTYKTYLSKVTGKGFRYSPVLGLSFQGKDARGTFKEIINMVKVNKFTIELSFESKTGKIIKLQM